MVFEGQVAKNTVIYSVFLTNVKKHWYLRCFHSHRNINSVIYEVFGSFEASRQACRKQKNTVKTSVSAITKRRKSVRKRVQKLKNPPPGQATCGTAKKDVANQKIEVKKLKNTGFFHFSLADFGRARSRTGVFRTVFYSVFWRRASRPIKNRRFWPKNAPPPPGKPVTFYECHPDDHAPAPSVRADLILFRC